jgi:hypothetical protein
MPHTLEYNYSLPTPTPVSLMILVATGNGGIPSLDPWFLATQAAPALVAVKVNDEDEEIVATPGVGNILNPGGTLAARSGVLPYTFLDMAGPLVPPLAVVLPLPWSIFGTRIGTAMTLAPAATSPPATHVDVVAHMKAKALLAAPPTLAEGTTTTPPTIRRLLGRRVAAMDRHPGISRGTWNPTVLRLLSAKVLNMTVGGGGFLSNEEGESSLT